MSEVRIPFMELVNAIAASKEVEAFIVAVRDADEEHVRENIGRAVAGSRRMQLVFEKLSDMEMTISSS